MDPIALGLHPAASQPSFENTSHLDGVCHDESRRQAAARIQRVWRGNVCRRPVAAARRRMIETDAQVVLHERVAKDIGIDANIYVPKFAAEPPPNITHHKKAWFTGQAKLSRAASKLRVARQAMAQLTVAAQQAAKRREEARRVSALLHDFVLGT